MTASPVFLLSVGRSGTNMFRSMLASAFPVTDVGEIFRLKSEPEPHDFFPFLVERARCEPEVAIPHQETQDRIFDDYISGLCSAVKTPFVVIDLKYPHTHNLNPLWHRPGKEPYILELIKRRGLRIVHLVRRNVLARHASIELALATDDWVRLDGTKPHVQDMKIVLDVDRLVDELSAAVHRIRYFGDCVRGYDNALSVFYEDLVGGSASDPGLAERLALFLDHPEAGILEPRTVKIAPPLRNYIENFDEVVGALKDTPFAEMTMQ